LLADVVLVGTGGYGDLLGQVARIGILVASKVPEDWRAIWVQGTNNARDDVCPYSNFTNTKVWIIGVQSPEVRHNVIRHIGVLWQGRDYNVCVCARVDGDRLAFVEIKRRVLGLQLYVDRRLGLCD
jgi:hypothetical protein